MFRPHAGLSWLLIPATALLYAQDADSLKNKNGSAMSLSDTLSVIRLIDSLMVLFEQEEQSVLHFRLNYNSNVMAAGRTLGIDQFGLAPGITWYHKTGLFLDATLC